MPRTEQVVEATMVKAEVPNLFLNEPSLTARADPEQRDKRRGQRSEERERSFDNQDDEAGSESMVWEKVGEESELDGRAGGRAKARNCACEPCALTVATRASSGSEVVWPPCWQRRFLDCRQPAGTLMENPDGNHAGKRDAVRMARISEARRPTQTAGGKSKAGSRLGHRWTGRRLQ
jgi:hypothetical protein